MIIKSPSQTSRIGFYRAKARELRLRVLKMIRQARKGHIGGSFSCADILVAVYYSGLFNLAPHGRTDHFIMSKGHCAAVLYAVLQDVGWFDAEQTGRYGGDDTLLGGHPDFRLPGVEVSSGSLGMGLGLGAGLALAAKLDGRAGRVLVLTGDGECAEGSIWEAAMFGARHRLDNLIWIVDRNRLGALDDTETSAGLEPLADKVTAFGWEVSEVDGHDFEQLIAALSLAGGSASGRPRALIAATVKGRGVSFMENEAAWHHGVPDDNEYQQALIELGQTGSSEGGVD